MTAVAGPVAGALVAAGVSQSIEAVREGFFARTLSPDEHRRAEFVFQEARKEIFNRRAFGEEIAPWVLTNEIGKRPSAAEVLEAGLSRARDQFEEQKLKHFAALLGWLFFQHSLSAADAHHFLALAARLRYRQLLLISVLADSELRATLPDRQWEGGLLWKDMALVMEAAELAHEGVILHEGAIHSGNSYANVNLRRMDVLMQGSVLHKGMDLRSVDTDARARLVEHIELIGRIVLDDRPQP